MFNRPEETRMTREEMEAYGRKTDARNAAYEHVEVGQADVELVTDQIPPPISEEEVRKRVGEQNFANVQDGATTTSIHS